MRPRSAIAAAAVVAAVAAPTAHAATRSIFTVAGDGDAGYAGDGGPARRAALDVPRGLAWRTDGSLLVAEAGNNAVRLVEPGGTIRTVAGTGKPGFGGDGGRAGRARLNFTHDVAWLRGDAFLIADTDNRRIRRVGASGEITTRAGDGNPGRRGDGGPAKRAQLNYPHAVAALPRGGFLIADTENDEVRRVLASGRIVRVAGDGRRGYAGDGGPAKRARLDQPFDVSPLPGGGFLVADAGNAVIRRVSAAGRITTVAGTGNDGFRGDGGAATRARLNRPHSVAALAGGAFLIADTENDRVRLVRDGRIATVAGSGVPGFAGDGGPADKARLDEPKSVEPTGGGGFLVADSGNDRVRFVSVLGPRPLVVGLGADRAGEGPVGVRRGPPTAGQGGRTLLSFRTSLPSRALVRVQRPGGGPITAVRVRAGRGRNDVPLPPALHAGAYRVRLDARTTDGQHALARGELTIVARRPPLRAAVTAAPTDGDAGVRPAAIALGAAGLALIAAGVAMLLRRRSLLRRDRERNGGSGDSRHSLRERA